MARPTLYLHRKFKRLCHLLGLPAPYVAGLLEFMWKPGYESGDPSFLDAMEIELAAEWPGDEGVFARAVVDVKFVDAKPEGGFEVHDFWDHCPDYVRKRWRREQERKGRTAELPEDGEGEDSPPGRRNLSGHSGGASNGASATGGKRDVVKRPGEVKASAGLTRQCAVVGQSVTGQCAVVLRSVSSTPAPAPAPAPARSAVHARIDHPGRCEPADRRSGPPQLVGEMLSAIGVFALKGPENLPLVTPAPGTFVSTRAVPAAENDVRSERLGGPWKVSSSAVEYFVPRFMELEPRGNRGRGVLAGWRKRVEAALSHPGGRDELERVLNEVEARRRACSARTRGYSVEPIRNEASWANSEVNAWNRKGELA